MKLSGCTLVKNAIKFQYPVIESINSLLPYVDEFIINVGVSEDGTEKLILKEFGKNSKVKIYIIEWDSNKSVEFISEQTNTCINLCNGDWVFILQADEAIHEKDGDKIKQWIERAELENAKAITCNYLHFAMSPNLIRKDYTDGFDAYDKEIRIIKNHPSPMFKEIISYGDGQSVCLVEDYFDSRGPQPLMHRPELVIESNIQIFHYGYLKDSKKLLDKKKYLDKFYKVSEPNRNEIIPEENGKYIFDLNSLKEFKGMHPKVMEKYISNFGRIND